MLSDFTEKKKPFFTLKTEFFQSPKNRIFPKGLTYAFSQKKGLTHAFGQKMPFFLYLDLIKMRLKIMLSDFAGKKKNFSKSKKLHFCKGVNPCFWSKNAIFSLFKFD